MTDPPVSEASLGMPDIAEQLFVLAERPEVNGDALTEIATEMASGGTRLQGVDLLAAYPPETLVPDGVPARRGGLALLATIRDLLVFAPIGITWWALGHSLVAWAGDGYPGQFLRYWQEAPAGVIRLSDAATWVVLVLAVVAALTVLVAIREGRGGADTDVAESRRELTTLLVTAAVQLAAPIDTRSAARRLAATAGQLTTSTGQLVEAFDRVGSDLHVVATAGPGNQLHEALTEWRRAADSLTKLGEGLTGPAQMVDSFVSMHAALQQEERRLRDALDNLAKRLEESTDVAVREGLAHAAVADGGREMTQQLSTALETFTTRTDMLHTLIYQVRALLIRLEDNGFVAPQPRSPRDNADDVPGDGWAR